MGTTQRRPALSSAQFRLLSSFGHGTNDLYWFILPVVLPMLLSAHDLRYSGGGTVLSVYLLVVALCSFGVGRLSDRTDRWRMLGIGFLLTATGFALASIPVSLPVLLCFLAIAGVGVSTFHPTMYGAVEETVLEDRGRFYGRFESWGNLTVAAMIVVSGYFLLSMEWNRVLLLAALPGLVAGITFLIARKPSNRRAAETVSNAEAAGNAEATGNAQTARDDQTTVTGAARSGGVAPTQSPHRGVLALFLISNMLRFITSMGVLGFVPTFFVHKVGLSPELAGYSTALFFVGGFIGNRLGGLLGDKYPPLRVMLVALAVVGPLVFLFGTFSSPIALSTTLFVLGVAAMVCIPLQNLALTKIGSGLGGGEVFGILMGVLTVTQAFSPAIFGAVADVAGLANGFRIFAAPAAVSWIFLLFVARSSEPMRDKPAGR